MWPPSGAVLLIRADAGPRMGAGHVMRSLALAQEWRHRGGEVVFASAELLPGLESRLLAEGIRVAALGPSPGSAHDATATIQLSHELAASWVLLDGYQFDATYQRTLRNAIRRLVLLDDTGSLPSYSADVIANPGLDAPRSWYAHRGIEAQLLLGPAFALLRREFLRPPDEVPSTRDHKGDRVLVTLGGADPLNVTGRVLEGLSSRPLGQIELRVLVGAGSPHLPALERAVARVENARLEVDVEDMSAAMAWADVAVSAGGNTCWELARIGVPSLLVVMAENQRANVSGLESRGVALNLGDAEQVSAGSVADCVDALLADGARRAAMSHAGRAMVDGSGARRVLAALAAQDRMRVRPATAGDAEVLFGWANDPVTRANSFHTEPIPWTDHVAWLGRVLAAPDRHLLITEWDSGSTHEPIAQVRIDADGTISLSLDPLWRGRGLAAPAVRRSLSWMTAHGKTTTLTAYIKPDNAASVRAFTQAGFEFDGSSVQAGQECLRFVLPEPGARPDPAAAGEGEPEHESRSPGGPS